MSVGDSLGSPGTLQGPPGTLQDSSRDPQGSSGDPPGILQGPPRDPLRRPRAIFDDSSSLLKDFCIEVSKTQHFFNIWTPRGSLGHPGDPPMEPPWDLILFYLFYSILFYPILFYAILFYSHADHRSCIIDNKSYCMKYDAIIHRYHRAIILYEIHRYPYYVDHRSCIIDK